MRRANPPRSPPLPSSRRKKNPVARALARHGGVLSLVLLLALGAGGVAYHRQGAACRAAAATAHARITELQNDHGRVQVRGRRRRERERARERVGW